MTDTLRKPIVPVKAAPTLNMPYGKAWRIDLPAVRARFGGEITDAGIDAWLVEAAWAHPAWHSYLVTLIHLRPMPGFKDPVLYHPNATHELLVQALDPDGDRDRLLEESTGWHCKTLEPANFAAQLVEISDDLARERVRKAVEMICAGDLSPDTDYRAQWVALFGDNMMKDRPQ